ncbi:excinuclease ABC subunit UvrC [Testudinibacter sp. TR-2022]|uniref:excinuclease ABC subunit UvrC n=1 Tax=Testudinibacter sp. TR-2022 TaxID=2585029 RepID=UPI001118E275|nr:excinuclease ABC subunit UvrC [Testudinibacter sp. TR-2022]TNH04707.1 excinuclease ABC subunit UvrC [Pasteurellaceae bacterium Phil31]TNH05289.1 excinuclease ABC subunit UvrC [Testudinibacter sp. TR-2022]TNH08996.1 excinuclease ABC subunit UvrC [Testudinibacter sp. TR-2022]TNH15415.1 excinuclease ABC subunit UvrC [Testudinibacter sp. TR-2022]TNH17115.1 excinuclease ABC subunit UvrC [Testudinibacter sp. TR-2022]
MFDAKRFLAEVTTEPGVYRMYDDKNTIIYVGKAKDLKKRLASYFRKNVSSKKTEALVSVIANIDVTVTHSETEALLLEHNYIKKYQPKYNVLLRDDKSYPFILLTKERHPRLTAFRGSKKASGDYFGPYPNAGAVRETLSLIQKLFPVRQCEDTTYRNRSRPCLQYQIGRCSAPCVSGYVSDEEYNRQVNYVRLFLQGKDQQVLQHLVEQMEQASQQLNFEKAALYRDQIQAVRAVTEQQFISNQNTDDLDIIAIAYQHGIACIHVMFIRQGKVLGSRSYFPKIPSHTALDEVSETFFGQFYLQAGQGRTIPKKIITNRQLEQKSALEQLLSQQAGFIVSIQDNAKGRQSKFLHLAQMNAEIALTDQLKQSGRIKERYQALCELLQLPLIRRMECFDISHTMGEQTIASCVVFNQEGPYKADYRRFNIDGITPGDDYAAMEKALLKRYNKPLEPEKIPDIIFIDGGKGQLNRALEVFAKLQVEWDKSHPLLIGVAKGEDRKAGLETLIISKGARELHLPADSLALHLIQHIRDESHRHAIGGHRKKRQKAFAQSGLESIEGIGSKRRQALLKYLGGMQGVKAATLEELASVPGISHKMAETLFERLRE